MYVKIDTLFTAFSMSKIYQKSLNLIIFFWFKFCQYITIFSKFSQFARKSINGLYFWFFTVTGFMTFTINLVFNLQIAVILLDVNLIFFVPFWPFHCYHILYLLLH